MPTLLAAPWPSGPVVVSTPVVQPCSGCPGQRLPAWRNVLRSFSVTASVPSAAWIPLRWIRQYSRRRRVSGRQNEAVTIHPIGGLRIVAQEALPQDVCCRRRGHRCPRMTGVGLLHGVDGQRPDRVDGKPVENFAQRCASFHHAPLSPRRLCKYAGWTLCEAATICLHPPLHTMILQSHVWHGHRPGEWNPIRQVPAQNRKNPLRENA